ncbi:MAG: hypothetical protein JHC84_13030 [Solirubrobacteraceae bacterium]|nr:hypothetical protein [Solirubrobacteraceae bacterium]
MSTSPPPPPGDPNDPTRQMYQPPAQPPGGTPPGAPPAGDDGGRGWIIALGVGLVIAIGLLAFVLLSGDDDEDTPASTTPTSITVVRPTVTDEIQTQVETTVQTVTAPPQTVVTPPQTVTVVPQRTATVSPGEQGGATVP